MNAILRIRGALPGTQVAVDGKPVGQIQKDERLSVDVSTGQHTIELSKQGYAPKRIARNFEAGQTVGLEAAEVILSPDQNAAEEARRKEEQNAWDAVNKYDRAALQQFIDGHPNSRFAADARSQINRLDQAKNGPAETGAATARRRSSQGRPGRRAEEGGPGRGTEEAGASRRTAPGQPGSAAQSSRRGTAQEIGGLPGAPAPKSRPCSRR